VTEAKAVEIRGKAANMMGLTVIPKKDGGFDSGSK